MLHALLQAAYHRCSSLACSICLMRFANAWLLHLAALPVDMEGLLFIVHVPSAMQAAAHGTSSASGQASLSNALVLKAPAAGSASLSTAVVLGRPATPPAPPSLAAVPELAMDTPASMMSAQPSSSAYAPVTEVRRHRL